MKSLENWQPWSRNSSEFGGLTSCVAISCNRKFDTINSRIDPMMVCDVDLAGGEIIVLLWFISRGSSYFLRGICGFSNDGPEIAQNLEG